MVENLTGDENVSVRAGGGEGRGFWYDEAPAGERERAREVLEALRLYRAAERAMRRRTRDEMSMGENELLALRFLLRQPGHGTRPRDLAAYLGISTAAVTVIIDRLERSGHLRRTPDESDATLTLIHTTAHADDDVRHTLGQMHQLMYGVASRMEPEAQRHVALFLREMADAVDGIAPASG